MKNHLTWQLPALLLTVIGATVFGDQLDDFAQDIQRARTEPVYQAGVSVGFRLDDLNEYTYVPSVGGNFYYFFHPMVALHGGLSYNSLTRLTSGTSYHSVVGDIGLRVNTNQAQVAPFLETGFSFPYYWGVNRGYEYVDFHPGLRIGAGLAWRVSKTLTFDLSVIQTVNHWRTEIDEILGVPADCPLGMDCPPLRQEPEGAYNPTLMELVVRFGL
jgi:hypothetical protein